MGPHVENNLPLDDDAEKFVERCTGEYRRWLISMAKVYAEQGNPVAASVTKRDVAAARSAILTWIGMAMGEFVLNGNDTFLHQFQAFNSIPYVPDDDDD